MSDNKNDSQEEMTPEDIIRQLKEGNGTLLKHVTNPDGSTTITPIYGNDTWDGVDRSLNIFGTMNDVLSVAVNRAQEVSEKNGLDDVIFRMDDSDVGYEVTVDDTQMPIMHVITCTKESVKIARYIRDEEKTVGVPMEETELRFENGTLTVSGVEVSENVLALFAFAVNDIRSILRERDILQELRDTDTGNAGVVITLDGKEVNAKIVRGLARPELPCLMFGGLFGQGIEDAVMMRPYPDEMLTPAIHSVMSLEEKIEAAEKGDVDLMDDLAMYYLNECDEPDAEKAVYWFRKLADAGVSTAMFSLGLHYAKGFGVERDFEQATYWMEKAAENGDDDAPAMAEKLREGISAQKAAEKGDAQAQADLARLYMFLGNSLDQADNAADYALVLDYAEKSAAQNNGDGIWALALAYEHGRGVEEDRDKALELYRRGAELGHAPSQHSYACYILRGECPDADIETAFEYCEKSALQGYKLAEFTLCKMYEMGEGTEPDLDKAIEWGEKAADGGDPDTMYEVAKLYTYEDEAGEMINAERAKYWYEKAAEYGHEMAWHILNGPMFNDDVDDEDDDFDFDFEYDEDDE